MSTLKKLGVQMGGRAIGTLAETPGGEIYFDYDAQWLADGFSLSPYFSR